jgi:hypothetical protein
MFGNVARKHSAETRNEIDTGTVVTSSWISRFRVEKGETTSDKNIVIPPRYYQHLVERRKKSMRL